MGPILHLTTSWTVRFSVQMGIFACSFLITKKALSWYYRDKMDDAEIQNHANVVGNVVEMASGFLLSNVYNKVGDTAVRLLIPSK